MSDGDQSLTLDAFSDLMHRLAAFAEAAGRTVGGSESVSQTERSELRAVSSGL